MRKILIALALVAAGGCTKADNEPGPGGVTVGEARALDEAAEMIESQTLPSEAAPSSAPAPAKPAPARR